MDPVERTAEIFYKVTRERWGELPWWVTLDSILIEIRQAEPDTILHDLMEEVKQREFVEVEPEIIKYWEEMAARKDQSDASQTRPGTR